MATQTAKYQIVLSYFIQERINTTDSTTLDKGYLSSSNEEFRGTSLLCSGRILEFDHPHSVLIGIGWLAYLGQLEYRDCRHDVFLLQQLIDLSADRGGRQGVVADHRECGTFLADMLKVSLGLRDSSAAASIFDLLLFQFGLLQHLKPPIVGRFSQQGDGRPSLLHLLK